MIDIKNKIKLFLKSFGVSFTAVLCLFITVFGTAKAYENTRRIGFGEYKKAVEYENGNLRILDFEFEIFS